MIHNADESICGYDDQVRINWNPKLLFAIQEKCLPMLAKIGKLGSITIPTRLFTVIASPTTANTSTSLNDQTLSFSAPANFPPIDSIAYWETQLARHERANFLLPTARLSQRTSVQSG